MALVVYLQRFSTFIIAMYVVYMLCCVWYGYLFYCVGGRMWCICGYDDVRLHNVKYLGISLSSLNSPVLFLKQT